MDSFAKCFQELEESQLRRIKLARGADAVLEASVFLRTEKLNASSLTQAIQDELHHICTLKYEEPIQTNAPRLEGYGWSYHHVQDHMNRFFKSLLEKQNLAIQKLLTTKTVDEA